MTDLRKAAEMALYGLLDARQVMAITYNDKHAYQDEIEALRQALAQPEPKPTLFFGRAVYFADPKTGEKRTQPEPFNLTCPKCNADRTKEACKGERMKCGIMGEAQSEQNFCQRCGKRLGDGIHTCTPPEQEPVNWTTDTPVLPFKHLNLKEANLKVCYCESIQRCTIFDKCMKHEKE